MFILRITLSLTILLCVKRETRATGQQPVGQQSHCPCGEIDFVEQNSGRVTNGEIVEDLRKYPWIVSIGNSQTMRPWGDCGGALISPTFVLTAAHCFPPSPMPGTGWIMPNMRNVPPPSYQIGLLGKEKYRPVHLIPVKRVILHPGYIPFRFRDDIALLELQHPVPCTQYSKPICVTPPEEVLTLNKLIRIAGFGEVAKSYPTDELREGTVRLIDGSNCLNYQDFYFSKSLCTVVNRNTRVCSGDSGTSAFLKHKEKYYSVGVTSHGDVNCTQDLSFVFTKTNAYLSFIGEHVRDLPIQPIGQPTF